MRKLGIDFGEKRIGIAVSDPLGITVQPLTVLEKKESYEKDIEGISGVIRGYQGEHGVDEIVVGLPKTLKGEIGISAQKVLDFVAVLKGKVDIPVITWDERMTTKAAEKNLIAAGMSRENRKKVIDKSAAAYMLQGYLDSIKK